MFLCIAEITTNNYYSDNKFAVLFHVHIYMLWFRLGLNTSLNV